MGSDDLEVFVTVGMSHFPFPRLINKIIDLAGKKTFTGKIIIQSGTAQIAKKIPKNVHIFPYLPAPQAEKYFRKSGLVISHAGVMSIFQGIRLSKNPPIFVPRQKRFREHVDDHQLEFARFFKERGYIIIVENIEELEKIIENYAKLASKIKPIKDDLLLQRRKLIAKLIIYCEGLK